MITKNFLISFDLVGAENARYDTIYEQLKLMSIGGQYNKILDTTIVFTCNENVTSESIQKRLLPMFDSKDTAVVVEFTNASQLSKCVWNSDIFGNCGC